MNKSMQVNLLMNIRKNIVIILIGCLYFGLLAYTMYQYITANGVTEIIIEMAVITTVFAVCGYVMFFYSRIRFRKRHVILSTEKELEITKKRIILDRITAVLFLIVGIIFMVLMIP